MSIGRQWLAVHNLAASTYGPGGQLGDQPLLSILPGGPATNQIANPAGLTDSKGNAVTCTRASTKYCRKSLVSDPANLCPSPENFGAAAWSKISSTVAPVVTQNDSGVMAPDGTQSAAKVVYSSGTAGQFSLLRGTSVVNSIGQPYTASVWAYSTTAVTIWVSPASTEGSAYSSTLIPAGVWTRCTATHTAANAANGVDIGWNDSQGTGPCPGATVWLWGAKVELASSASAYVSPMLVSMAANVPSVEPEGLLVEGASTNLCLQSQTLDNASWGKASAAVTADQAIAPDGTLTADLVAFSAGNISSANIAAAASIYTGSIYLRTVSGSTSAVLVQIMDASAGFAVLAQATPTLTTSWQRVTVTLPSAAVAAHNLILVVASGVTTVSIYAWGGQMEVRPYASSYVATVAASASRAAETCSIANPLPSATNFFVGVTAQPNSGGDWAASGGVPLGVGVDSTANSARFADGFFADYDGTANFRGQQNVGYGAFGTIAHRRVGGKTSSSAYVLVDDGTNIVNLSGPGTGIASQPANIYLGGAASTWFWGWVKDIRAGNTYASAK